jgi:heavy metal sensor kinase
MKAPRSIRSQLIAYYVALLSLVFICFGAYIYWGFHAFLIHSLDKTLDRRAQQIASTILAQLPTRGPNYVANEIQARYAPELNERIMRITGPGGHTVYASTNAVGLSAPKSSSFGKASHRHETVAGTSLRIVSLPYRFPDGSAYMVEVGASERPIRTALLGLMGMIALGFLILLGLAIVGGYSLLGRALRPVDKIVRAAEGITYQNLNERLPVPHTGDEFQRISEALNRMIQRLDEAFRIATRFSGDASHELRTPLTVIRGELESLLKSALPPPELRQRIGEILVEMERLTWIVEGLLLVSRLESGEACGNPRPLDLGTHAGLIADQMEPLAQEKELTLRRELESGVLVNGDEVRLKQIVVNLLDNAIKYTPSGGRVTIRVRGENGHAQLEVADTGIGIDAESQRHVFERFYRAKEVRSGQIEGTGLGLAIVHSIVDAHQGSISLTSTKDRGSSFTVQLLRIGRATTSVLHP